jgi:hypothetical protein
VVRAATKPRPGRCAGRNWARSRRERRATPPSSRWRTAASTISDAIGEVLTGDRRLGLPGHRDRRPLVERRAGALMRRAMYLYAWDLEEEGVSASPRGFATPASIRCRWPPAITRASSCARTRRTARSTSPRTAPSISGPTCRATGHQATREQPRGEFDALRARASRPRPAAPRLDRRSAQHPARADHPDSAPATPIGDPLYNSLCPSQPEVREYLVALAPTWAKLRALPR